MKCTVEMCSGTIIYIPSFIKIGSGIQKLIWRNTQTASDLISLLLIFFKIRTVVGLRSRKPR
jgi:hypothetical protein